jgi:site-specific recombinase XerC
MSPPLDNLPLPTETTVVLFPCAVAQLVENVRGKVPRDKFKELKSAAKVLATCLHKAPATWVIGSVTELVEAIHSIHPLKHGIKASYLRVSSSRVMTILRLNGIEFLSGNCKTDLPVPYQAAIKAARALDERRLQCLMPFLRNRLLAGRKLTDIDQSDFDAYDTAVDGTSNRKNKSGAKVGARRDWNYFAKHVDAWPKSFAKRQTTRKDYLLPKDQQPEAWAEFKAREHLVFRGNRKFGKRRKNLSTVTIESRDYTFRRIISAAVAGGIDKRHLKTMADVCDRTVLETAYNFILDRRGNDVEGTCDICRLAGLMFAVAEQWVGVTDGELAAHRQLYEDWEHIQQGMAERNERLLTRLSTDKAIAAFLRTPQRVMDEYADTVELTIHDCIRMQMASAMSILTRALIRMDNLMQIELGTHLLEGGWGAVRHLTLAFGKHEVKNGEYLETILSPRTVKVLDTYMERAWPKLKRGCTTKALFPGYDGVHKSASTFGPQLSAFVFRETGVRVTPHQFRHLGGYFHLLRHPGDYASVQKMLGHRKIETTIKYYTGPMDRRAAFKKYDGHIDARIDEADGAEAATQKLGIKNYA